MQRNDRPELPAASAGADPAGSVTQEWVVPRVLAEVRRQDAGLADRLRPLRAPVVPAGAAGLPLTVWFGVTCECGTAAVLSVEIARTKTRGEVLTALPQVADRLRLQHRGFAAMPCSAHSRMRSEMFN